MMAFGTLLGPIATPGGQAQAPSGGKAPADAARSGAPSDFDGLLDTMKQASPPAQGGSAARPRAVGAQNPAASVPGPATVAVTTPNTLQAWASALRFSSPSQGDDSGDAASETPASADGSVPEKTASPLPTAPLDIATMAQAALFVAPSNPAPAPPPPSNLSGTLSGVSSASSGASGSGNAGVPSPVVDTAPAPVPFDDGTAGDGTTGDGTTSNGTTSNWTAGNAAPEAAFAARPAPLANAVSPPTVTGPATPTPQAAAASPPPLPAATAGGSLTSGPVADPNEASVGDAPSTPNVTEGDGSTAVAAQAMATPGPANAQPAPTGAVKAASAPRGTAQPGQPIKAASAAVPGGARPSWNDHATDGGDASGGSTPTDAAVVPVAATASSSLGAGEVLPPIQQVAAAVATLVDASPADATQAADAPSTGAATPAATPATAGTVRGTSDGGREIVIKLDPENLGNVSIRLKMTGNKVDVAITVSDPRTLTILNQDRHVLAAAVSAAGLAGDALTLTQAVPDTAAPPPASSMGADAGSSGAPQGDASASGGSANGQRRDDRSPSAPIQDETGDNVRPPDVNRSGSLYV